MPAYKKFLPYLGLILAVAIAGCGSSGGDPQTLPERDGGPVAITYNDYLDGNHAAPLSSNGSCFACHAVEGEGVLKTVAGSGSPEYNLCVSCHSNDPNMLADFPASHATFSADYAAANNACSQCHDPHAATKFEQGNAATITSDWIQSGHGDVNSGAFTYNFPGNCLSCHSGSVFAQAVSGVTASDINTSGGGQVIGCVACHDLTTRDDDGTFELGALRQIDSVTFPSEAVVSMAGGNNLCLTCHQGRSSTPTVDAVIAVTPAGENFSFSNIHYAPAGATLFGSDVQGGYEYPGRNYARLNDFSSHTALGFPQLTTCIGCHVGSNADHSFKVSIANCQGCHPGGDFTAMNGSPAVNADRIATLTSDLDQLLTDSGVIKLNTYPYFEGIQTASQLKAAYNLQFARNDPGGYIHNGLYIRQLLTDSINDLGGIP